MPERRGSRFAAEALFLVALAVALTLARLDPIEIAGAMLVGWLVVAAIEWAAWRGEPHYGSGLPPRYHVPLVSLPAPQPLEQVDRGYPDASREDAPTWIASAALRAEVLGTWPLAAPAPPEEDDEEPEPVFATVADRDADPWTVAAIPEAPLGESVSPPASTGRTRRAAHYNLDPLSDPSPHRRFGRKAGLRSVEVLAWPPGGRRAPGAAIGT
ncbi:MAG TPA: hypothetical protein VFJ93_01830 [Gaiellaceae bacterium]|nr:hypothetical protein [Gaiellaceae bacterium]